MPGSGTYCSIEQTCSCWCCADTDGDGQEDDWVTSCSRAELNLTFNSLLGTMYLVMGSTGDAYPARRSR